MNNLSTYIRSRFFNKLYEGANTSLDYDQVGKLYMRTYSIHRINTARPFYGSLKRLL